MKASKIVLTLLAAVLLLGVGLAAGYQIRSEQADSHDKMLEQKAKDADKTADAPATTDGHCTTDQLSAKADLDQGGGAAGSVYATLTLTNTSSSSCTLNGYPGVSLVDVDGKPIGEAAVRDTTKQAQLVTVGPSSSAVSQLRFVQNNFDEGVCKDGGIQLKVYPPNEVTTLLTTSPHTMWCPGFSVSALSQR